MKQGCNQGSGIHHGFEEGENDSLREVAKAQRRSLALGLPADGERYPHRTEAMARAYLSGAYTLAEIGTHVGVHYMAVGRALKSFEQRKERDMTT